MSVIPQLLRKLHIPSLRVAPSGFLNLMERSVVQEMSFFSRPTDTDPESLTKVNFNESEGQQTSVSD